MKDVNDFTNQAIANSPDVSTIAGSLWPEVLNISGWVAVGVIVFTGVLWMFGSRTQAMQRMLDGAIGYLVIQHAPSILVWLHRI